MIAAAPSIAPEDFLGDQFLSDFDWEIDEAFLFADPMMHVRNDQDPGLSAISNRW